jgi:two-component sensor histidine kinase
VTAARVIRKTQIVFREVNQRIAEITATHKEMSSEFLCECGRAACVTVIELALSEYKEVRKDDSHFITALGHRVDGVDRLVEERDGFEIVALVS